MDRIPLRGMVEIILTAEEARKLVTALSLIVGEHSKCLIVIEQGGGSGIGANTYVGLSNSEEKTDITDYGAW
jgi:hypothetical protein